MNGWMKAYVAVSLASLFAGCAPSTPPSPPPWAYTPTPSTPAAPRPPRRELVFKRQADAQEVVLAGPFGCGVLKTFAASFAHAHQLMSGQLLSEPGDMAILGIRGSALPRPHLFICLFVQNQDLRPQDMPVITLLDERGAIHEPLNVSPMAEDAYRPTDRLNPDASKTVTLVFDLPMEQSRKYRLAIAGPANAKVEIPIEFEWKTY